MRTANLPKIIRREFQEFDYEGIANQIMRADGLQYSIIIDFDGSLYWDYNVDRKVRDGRNLVIMDCPFYSEPVNPGKRELKLLAKELKEMLYYKIIRIPDYYWKSHD